jgi:iron complex transport system substrate-binding protein
MSGGHWTPGLLELAGGVPVLAEPDANSRVLAWDEIAAADPDVVLVAPCGFDLARTLQAAGDLAAVPQWRVLRALLTGRAYAIDGNAFVNRPGPRLIDSAEIFAGAMLGEPLNPAHAARIEPS